jgi:glutamate-5-semialdehyde dehydrogenase
VVTDLESTLASAARARRLAPPPGDPRYRQYCVELGRLLAQEWQRVSEANAEDVERAAANDLSAELLDRLSVSKRHLDTLVALTEECERALPEMTGRGPVRQAGNGMKLRRLPKPLGVLLMIYEARPTVTVEGALLPVAVGNVTLLRGGTETAATNAAFGAIAAAAADAAGLPPGMVQVLTGVDRTELRRLLEYHDQIDVVIPRGSPTLIEFCLRRSAIPVIASGGGVNHLYVDASADIEQAAALVLDSKLGEPTACNTLELVLAHSEIAAALAEALVTAGAKVGLSWTLRLDRQLADRLDRFDRTGTESVTIAELAPHDLGREFLDRSLGVLPVAGLDEAIDHIDRHGSRHTEGIAAEDPDVIERFLAGVDAAALVVNGSLRLHDGATMSLGPELSISTGKLHVRGPVGMSALLTYSWVIEGDGAVRGIPELAS